MRIHSTLISLVAPVVISAACASSTARNEERCAKLNDDIASCAGAGAPALDCKQVSQADIDRLEAATGSGACTMFLGALPLDGDPKSASCKVLGVGCVASITPAPLAGSSTLYPIVLVNGIDTSPLFRYSDRITKVMKDAGYDVHLATLTPYEPPNVRAPELYTRIGEIIKATGAAKVNLICHSLGGLDCRYLASEGGAHWELGIPQSKIASRIASITTVGTAHRGTAVADLILTSAPSGDRGNAIDAFASLAGDWFTPHAIENDVDLRAALAALSESNAPAFNDEILDAEGIYYQSWAGVTRVRGASTPAHDARVLEECGEAIERHDWIALPLLPFVDTLGKDEPSDGLTTVASAKWGEFRGCIPADHMEQLGQRNLPDVNVQNGFDIARFYANVAADLAERGF